ncbi:hypothetical protein WDU94_004358 [Cyamophila willieti]
MGYKVELIIILSIWVDVALSKPIQKMDKPDNEIVLKRLSELQDIVKLSMLQNDLRILRTLPEEKLSLVEELLKLWSSQEELELEEEMEQPQGYEPPIEDVYMSDAPADMPPEEDNSTLAYSEANATKALREMNREIRLNFIRTNILATLGFTDHLPMGINSTDIAAEIEHLKPPSYSPVSEGYAEKIQSFYPSCEMPRNTTLDLWKNNGTVMNLFFNNIQSVLATSNILKAKLRLFKHSRSADNFIPSEEGCPQTTQDEKSESDNPLEPKPVEDRLIRVSIYWYTRPLKRIKDKKKLLDSQMLPLAW